MFRVHDNGHLWLGPFQDARYAGPASNMLAVLTDSAGVEMRFRQSELEQYGATIDVVIEHQRINMVNMSSRGVDVARVVRTIGLLIPNNAVRPLILERWPHFQEHLRYVWL